MNEHIEISRVVKQTEVCPQLERLDAVATFEDYLIVFSHVSQKRSFFIYKVTNNPNTSSNSPFELILSHSFKIEGKELSNQSSCQLHVLKNLEIFKIFIILEVSGVDIYGKQRFEVYDFRTGQILCVHEEQFSLTTRVLGGKIIDSQMRIMQLKQSNDNNGAYKIYWTDSVDTFSAERPNFFVLGDKTFLCWTKRVGKHSKITGVLYLWNEKLKIFEKFADFNSENKFPLEENEVVTTAFVWNNYLAAILNFGELDQHRLCLWNWKGERLKSFSVAQKTGLVWNNLLCQVGGENVMLYDLNGRFLRTVSFQKSQFTRCLIWNNKLVSVRRNIVEMFQGVLFLEHPTHLISEAHLEETEVVVDCRDEGRPNVLSFGPSTKGRPETRDSGIANHKLRQYRLEKLRENILLKKKKSELEIK